MKWELQIQEFGIPDKGVSAMEFESLQDVQAFFHLLTNGSDAPTIRAQLFQDDLLVFNITKTLLNTYRFSYAG